MPRRSIPALIALVLALLMAGSATAQGTPEASPTADAALTIGRSETLGTFLATPDGMALYTYSLDTPGEASMCNDDCAKRWPPYLVTAAPALPEGVDGELSVVERADGAMQLAWNDSPLYQFMNDFEPGDTNGHGVGSGWVQCDCHGPALATPPPSSLVWSLVLIPADAGTPAASS